MSEVTQKISDDSFGDLGLFDNDRVIEAAIVRKVQPQLPVQPVQPQPAPQPASNGFPDAPNNMVSEETTVVPGLGSFTHRVNERQGRNLDLRNPEPNRIDADAHVAASSAKADTYSPGHNPSWAGQLATNPKPIEVVDGVARQVRTIETMGDTGYQEQAPPPPVEPVAAAQAPVEAVTPAPAPSKAKKTKKGDLDEAPAEIKDVMILRPILRDVHSLVHQATLAVFDRNTYAYDAQQGDAMVYHSRNMLADRFMKSGFEWALWWDDDVVPPVGNEGWSRGAIQSLPANYPGQFLRINPIQRLKSHGKTIIGGLYFARKAPWTAICHRTTATVNSFRNVPRQDVLPVDWVGTGFLLVHRSVFEAIQAKHPELAPKAGGVNQYESVWNYFQPDHQQGEDVSFCARAKACGHQPFVDLSTVCFHVGDYAFGPWNQR